MAEYRLSPAAERDLEGIWKYTRKEWGLEQAERYIDLLTAAFEVLAESPKLAPACDYIRLGYRRRAVRSPLWTRLVPLDSIAIVLVRRWYGRRLAGLISWSLGDSGMKDRGDRGFEHEQISIRPLPSKRLTTSILRESKRPNEQR